MADYETIKKEIDDLLSYLTLCDQPSKSMLDGGSGAIFHRFNPATMRRLEPMELGTADGRSILNPEVFDIQEVIDEDINIGVISLPVEEDKGEFKYSARSIERLKDLSFARGKVGQMFPNMHVLKHALLGHDGTLHTNVYFCVPSKGSWKFLTCQHEYRDTRRVFHQNLTDMRGHPIALSVDGMVSLQFTQRYEWGVEVAAKYGPSLNITIPPRAIPEIFRFRDVPDGKKRRSQLRNWIQDYWRKGAEEGESVYVRKHLRGSMEFTIDDLRCTVHPSKFDAEMNEKLAKERV